MSGQYQVLIADDNFTIQDTLSKYLGRLGCQTSITNTAEKCIEKLGEIKVDCIFAGLCVRENGARSIARWVKDNFPDIKIFVVTGWKGDLEQKLLNFEGIHQVIHKPLIFSEVRDKFIEYFG